MLAPPRWRAHVFGMPIVGKLDAVVKFTSLPTEVTTNKQGWKTFSVVCEGRPVSMTLRPKYWQKLEAAVKDWPSWVAAVAGQLVLGQGQSFVLQEPSLQLFEKKAKDGAGATSPVAGGTAVPGVVATPKISAPPEPAAPSVDPPADAKIPSRSTPGKLVEVFVSRKSSS